MRDSRNPRGMWIAPGIFRPRPTRSSSRTDVDEAGRIVAGEDLARGGRTSTSSDLRSAAGRGWSSRRRSLHAVPKDSGRPARSGATLAPWRAGALSESSRSAPVAAVRRDRRVGRCSRRAAREHDGAKRRRDPGRRSCSSRLGLQRTPRRKRSRRRRRLASTATGRSGTQAAAIFRNRYQLPRGAARARVLRSGPTPGAFTAVKKIAAAAPGLHRAALAESSLGFWRPLSRQAAERRSP